MTMRGLTKLLSSWFSTAINVTLKVEQLLVNKSEWTIISGSFLKLCLFHLVGPTLKLIDGHSSL